MVALQSYTVARHNMIEGQIRPNRVNDPAVLQAFLAVPRERFVPRERRGIAYIDSAVPLGRGRYLVEPMIIARLLLAAGITASDVVLDVGCGSGYSAALLSRLAATVVAIESDDELVAQARAAVAELGLDNVVVYQAPLAQGLPAQGPYDAIVVDGAVPEVPPALLDQLNDGGRLVAVVTGHSGEFGVGQARLFRRHGRAVSSRVLFDAAPHLLPGFTPKARFQF